MSYVGKLKFHTDKWYQSTSDPWVLEAISGYKILFDTLPYPVTVPNEIPFQDEQWHIVNNEVSELLSKGAVVPCWSEPGEFISTLFIVQKKRMENLDQFLIQGTLTCLFIMIISNRKLLK